MEMVEDAWIGRNAITGSLTTYKSAHIEPCPSDRFRAVIMDARCRSWYDMGAEYRATIVCNGTLNCKGSRPSDLPFLAEAASMKELADILELMPEYWAQIDNIAIVLIEPDINRETATA